MILDELFKKEIKAAVESYMTDVLSKKTSKTPLQAYDLVNKKYVDSKSFPRKTGLASFLLGSAPATETIAHGYGSTPHFLKIIGFSGTGTTIVAGVGTYDGTNQQFVSLYGVSTPDWATGNVMQFSDGSGNTVQAVASFTSTNIVLTWTVTGSNTFAAQFHFIWEVS